MVSDGDGERERPTDKSLIRWGRSTAMVVVGTGVLPLESRDLQRAACRRELATRSGDRFNFSFSVGVESASSTPL